MNDVKYYYIDEAGEEVYDLEADAGDKDAAAELESMENKPLNDG
jgi:hypothetical protein